MRVSIYDPWRAGLRATAAQLCGAGDTDTAKNWVRAQRAAVQHGMLQVDQVAQLTLLGVRLQTDIGRFDSVCEDLAAYQARHGEGLQPASGTDLGRRLRALRRRHARGRLSATHVARLDGLGVPWKLARVTSADEVGWQRFIAQVEAHVARTGSATVGYDQVGFGRCTRELYDLAYAATYAARFGLLSASRRARLVRLGLVVVRPVGSEFIPWRIVPVIASARAA